MTLELNIALNSVQGATISDLSLQAPESLEALEIPTSSTYYSSQAPYCVLYGPGPVGQRVKKTLSSLGAAVEVRYLNAEQIAVQQDVDLKLALQEVSIVALCACVLRVCMYVCMYVFMCVFECMSRCVYV